MINYRNFRCIKTLAIALLTGLRAFSAFSAFSQEHISFEDRALHALSEVMIRDITNPPVASRDYVYTLIAFYEGARPGNPDFKTFAGRLNGLGALGDSLLGLPLPDAGAYDWLVAGITAFHDVAYGLVFSKDMFQQLWDSIDIDLRHRPVSPDVYARSVAFGVRMGAAVLAWSRKDNYAYTRTLPRFTPSKEPGTWQQTAPEYMEAIEPNWNKIRTMVLVAPGQFAVPPPFAISSDTFARSVRDVYEIGNHLTREQVAIADFWDCNPFAVQTVGHLMFSVKKISPGGHWMNIVGVAVRDKHLPLVESLYAYSLTSIAIFDAIIACWDEKYVSNYIRPITAIQNSLSKSWQPHLQTPPFPEYVSGHSCISTSASVVLTALFGSSFSYVDDTEKGFGLPARSFHSFAEAAAEASISRLYGGIHFRQAIVNGQVIGGAVGKYVLSRLN